MDIDKRAEVEPQVFLAPSDDKIHNNLNLEPDVEESKIGNYLNGELPINFTSIVMANAYSGILPAPLMPGSTRLRKGIANHAKIMFCPGVYDELSARIALSLSFGGFYITGVGPTASRPGAADLGLAQLHGMKTNAEKIANLAPNGVPIMLTWTPAMVDRSRLQNLYSSTTLLEFQASTLKTKWCKKDAAI